MLHRSALDCSVFFKVQPVSTLSLGNVELIGNLIFASGWVYKESFFTAAQCYPRFPALGLKQIFNRTEFMAILFLTEEKEFELMKVCKPFYKKA
jgi:hypothetical protein